MQLKNNWTLVILKTLRFLTICVLFRVLKRLEEEEGGGGAYRYRLCDTRNEANVPS